MTGIILTTAALYGLLVCGIYIGQRRLMYFPDASVPDPADYCVPEMTALRLPVGGGVEILVWWHPPAGEARPVVIYFHGNADHIGNRGYKARILIDAGYGVLLTSYRYNAGAGGAPSEEALISDGAAAVDFVAAKGVAPRRIVLYGESLGTGIAVALAARRDIGGLILESPYSSVADVARSRYWFVLARWLLRDRYDSIARIGRVEAPILLFHGDADTTIPVRFARKLFAAAPEPKEGHFLPGGTHVDLWDRGAGRLVLDFLARRAAGEQGGEQGRWTG